MSQTLRQSVSVRGIGLHTGVDSDVTLHPAEPGFGFRFLVNGTQIPASVHHVVDTRRCTVLGAEATIATVEHLMSAFVGLGVTDCLVECSAGEMPIGDGSALCWTDALLDAGLTDTASAAPSVVSLVEPITVRDSNGHSVIVATPLAPNSPARLAVVVDWEQHTLAASQIASFTIGDDYAREIAPARTFGFIEEIEALRNAGLALGGSTDNAIVVYPDRFDPPLRFENEMARHKLLDLLGDLALAGVGIPHADIVAYKPGHRLNVKFAATVAGVAADMQTAVQ